MKIVSNEFIDNAKTEESSNPILHKDGSSGSNAELKNKKREEVVVDIKDPDVSKIKTLCYNRYGHFGIKRTTCTSHANLNFLSSQVSVTLENRGITDNDFSQDYTLWQRTTGKTLQIISRSLTILDDLDARVPLEINLSVDYSLDGLVNSKAFFNELTDIVSKVNTSDTVEKFKNTIINDNYINNLVK